METNDTMILSDDIEYKKDDKRNESVNISIIDIFKTLLKRWYIVLAALLISAGIAVGYTEFLCTPMYDSTSTFYILPEGEFISTSEMNIAIALATDYPNFITDKSMLDRTIENLEENGHNYGITAKSLKKMISIKNESRSTYFTITVTSPDPEMSKNIVNALCQEVKEWSNAELQRDAKIMTKGEASPNPSSPSLLKNTAIGIAIGTILACAVIILIKLLDNRADSEDEIEEKIAVPCLGILPHVDKKKNAPAYTGYDSSSDTSSHVGEKVVERIPEMSTENDYTYTEHANSIRTNIMFSGEKFKTIVITSCLSNDGKTTSALGIATSLARQGKKTLLLDADIRKSVILGRLIKPVPNVKGLAEHLTGQATLDEVIYQLNETPNQKQPHTEFKGERLHILFAGHSSPNPAELFGDAKFAELIDTLREKYDYIIIDAPPLGLVVDAAVIAHKCDGAIILANHGTTTFRMLSDVKSKLNRSGCKVMGIVLNNVRLSSGRYGYSKYKKYGKYHNYGYAVYGNK